MFGLSSYMLIGGAVAFAAVGGFAYWQYERANNLQADNATLEANVQIVKDALETQVNENDRLRDNVKKQIQKLELMRAQVREITDDRDDAVDALDEHRKTLADRVKDDAADLTRRINRGTRRVWEHVRCATDQRCSDPEAGADHPSGAPVSGEAPADRLPGDISR